MSNPYFKFKQFVVKHDLCAMKVGTDGVLLGAWVEPNYAKQILDIGTGTGLIALMLAQRCDAQIKAIDIDAGAVAQASINIIDSPWVEQISCELASLQEYALLAETKFDVIVSNPPFFNKSLKSPDQQRTTARHTDSLPIDELIGLSAQLLNESGRLALIYPYQDKDILMEVGMKYNLYANRVTNVYPTPKSHPKRVLIELTKNKGKLFEDDLIIEVDRHIYSEQFINLAKDFYLKL